jgi:competence protein ComEC
LFVIAVFSFACGIYLNAIYDIPLKFIVPPLFLILFFIPFFIRKNSFLPTLLLIACFILAGIARLGIATIGQAVVYPGDGTKEVYVGLITESSPNTKIVKLTSPGEAVALKVIMRTPQSLNINDAVKVFGELREVHPTFKNPYLLSWKWLKKLEGISYELRGTIISITPGKHFIHGIRNNLKQKIDASRAQHTGIMKALTIGDTTGLDEVTKNLFLHTGTSHILAISGSNIGIVTAFFFFITRFLIGRIRTLRLRGDDTRYAALVTIPFAFVFMLIAGSSIPTMRATIMITVYMLSIFIERGRNIFNTIALSALAILLVYPHSLFTPSFQLTYASVVFIILFTQRIFPLLKTDNLLFKWFLLSIGMTISATVGTLPIVLYHFYGVNPFSVLHNLVAVPLMCIIAMPLSLLGIVLPWGEYLLRVTGEVLAITIRILTVLNWGYIYPIVRPNLFEITLYFAFLFVLLHMRKKTACALMVLVVLPVVSGYAYYAYFERFNKDLRINVIDVGNGDAILVEAPAGMRMLIDGGGFHTGDFDIGKSILTPILLSKKILTLDYVINTHPHGDHLGGIPTVIRDFTINNFSTGYYFISQERFVDLMKLLRKKKIPLTTWKRGDKFFLRNGLEIVVLNPDSKAVIDDLNNASLVVRIGYENFSILFTGDIGSDVEKKLVMRGNYLKADVLKIPHHGSKHSNSHEFIAAVQPKIAVLSAGKGLPGIPSQEALKRYDAFSIPVLRTDRDGMIQMWKRNIGVVYSTQERVVE